jgi:hypothetical protein
MTEYEQQQLERLCTAVERIADALDRARTPAPASPDESATPRLVVELCDADNLSVEAKCRCGHANDEHAEALCLVRRCKCRGFVWADAGRPLNPTREP